MWMNALRRLPQSELVLLEPSSPATAANLIGEAATRGEWREEEEGEWREVKGEGRSAPHSSSQPTLIHPLINSSSYPLIYSSISQLYIDYSSITTHPCIHPSTHTFIHHPFIHSSIHPSIHPSIRSSVHLPIQTHIHICPSHPSTH